MQAYCIIYEFPLLPVIVNSIFRHSSHPQAGHIMRYKFSLLSDSGGFLEEKQGGDFNCLAVKRR